MNNKNLAEAKKTKNDEFYTKLEDIEKELSNYKKQLKGKTILCNCDDPKLSNFWKYLHENFSKLRLKEIIAVYKSEKEEYISRYNGGNDKDNNYYEKTLIKNGDFRSMESISLLKEADIIITNPPFSLFREYVKILIDNKKKFLIVGSLNAITYKEIFKLIKDNKIWLGFNHINEFKKPDNTYKKFGNILWYTNLNISKRYINLIGTLNKSYYENKKMFQKYDNYNAINVDRINDIPYDYNGIIGVPITFIDKYNPKEFKILGIANGRKDFEEESWPTKRYINAIQINKDGSIENGSKVNTRACLKVEDKNINCYKADNIDYFISSKYARILIKKR